MRPSRRREVRPRSTSTEVRPTRASTSRGSSADRGILGVLAEAARELSDLIEAGRVGRERRQEARRLLMEAWLALEATGRDRPDIESLRELLRSVDRLVADSNHSPRAGRSEGLLRVSPRLTLMEIQRGAVEPTGGRGAVARILALERTAADLLRRTDFMVEQAVKTLKQQGLARSAPSRGSAVPGGREDLELVWGETEG